MPDAVLTRDGPVGVPLDYKVPQSGELLPLTVRATIDGTSAASAFYATVQVLAPSGRVMGSYVSTSIAAGGSADVTWFPGVTGTLSAGKVLLVGARIEAHASQSLTSAAPTNLTYDTVSYDTAGMANLGADNRILTAQVTGVYLVVCQSVWAYSAGSAGRRLNVIMKNGYYATDPTPGDNVAGQSVNTVWTPLSGPNTGSLSTTTAIVTIPLSVGDFVSSGGLQESGAALNVTGSQGVFLSANLIGVV